MKLASTTDVAKKKKSFYHTKTYFIILLYHFITSYLLDVLLFNSIY